MSEQADFPQEWRKYGEEAYARMLETGSIDHWTEEEREQFIATASIIGVRFWEPFAYAKWARTASKKTPNLC